MIRAARNLFEKKGYHNTSLRELCDEVKISKTTFYNYFGSKDALIRIIFNAAFEDTREATESRFGDDSKPLEAVAFIIDSMLDDISSYRNVVSTAYELMLRSNELADVRAEYRNLILKYVHMAHSKGLFRENISEETIVTILEGGLYSLTFSKDFDGAHEKVRDLMAAVIK